MSCGMSSSRICPDVSTVQILRSELEISGKQLKTRECEDDLSAPGCAGSCNETIYANLVACLDCLAYNGSPENDPTTGASAILTRFNDFCQKQNATVSLVAAITATATTT